MCPDSGTRTGFLPLAFRGRVSSLAGRAHVETKVVTEDAGGAHPKEDAALYDIWAGQGRSSVYAAVAMANRTIAA